MEIKLEHVTKKIKGVPVLQDVTKTFTGGCIYGLSGKNGCGKTMLMRTMAGLIYPSCEDQWKDARKGYFFSAKYGTSD